MGVHAVADRVSSHPPSRSVRHEQPIAHAYPLGGSLYASSGHSLSTTGKYEPAGRRFFECALHPGILCSRRALFGLGRSLTVHIRTQRHLGQTPGKTTRFLKCTELRASRRVGQLVMTPLLTRGRPWQVLTRQWVVAPRRSRAPPARRLQSKSPQDPAHACLEIHKLRKKLLARDKQCSHLSRADRLGVYGPEPAHTHKLGDPARVVAIRFYRHR